MILEHSVTLDAEPTMEVGDPEPPVWIDDILQEAYEQAQAPPPVRLADLLEDLAFHLSRYLYFPQPATAMLVACWLTMTYCFREFSYCGYVAVRSQRPSCGKTRLLDLLSALAKSNPHTYTSPTPAVLFRSNQDVVLIDEVDRLRGQDRHVYGMVLSILNAGFASTGVVPRTERVDDKGRFAVVNHPVYGPKAFAGLEKLEPALASRCFHIEMRPSPCRLPRFSLRLFGETAQRLRRGCEGWMNTHRDAINKAYTDLPDELHVLRRYDDRYQDIAEPLVVLALTADAEYGGTQRILPVLLEGLRLAARDRTPVHGERLAVAVHEILSPVLGDQDTCFIPSKDLLTLVQAGGLPWIDSTRDLATVLGEVGLHSRSNGSVHGYDITNDWLGALNLIRQA